MFRSLFFADTKKNLLLASAMLLFNLFAAILEGLSFAALLHGFSLMAEKEQFILFLLWAVGGQLLRSAFSYVGQLAATYLTINLQMEAQKKIYSQIFRMTYSMASRYKIGDLIYHATSPSSFFPQVMDCLNRALISVLMVSGYLIFMVILSGRLTLSILFLFLVALIVQKFLIKKISDASNCQAKHTAELNEKTAQNLEGLKTVHLFARQKQILKKIESTLQAIARQAARLGRWHHLIAPVNEGVAIVLVGASLILASFFLHGGEEGIPLLMVYLTLTYRLGTRLQVVMGSWGGIAFYFGQLKRMNELLQNEGKDFLKLHGEKIAGFEKEIAFLKVSFSYPEKTEGAIHSLSFQISKGKTIALVGSSGGGKSTLLSLLLGLYEPTQGEIHVDGRALSQIELSSWRELFGVVNQETFLFHETIEENIRFGKLEATFEDIMEAARIAGANRFIEKLPQGFQTIIGEKGHRLSGGERQRLSLARALIRKPQILVLDEATSHLDSESEQVIQGAIESLRGKTTLVIVAHRLSTIKNADEILIVEGGELQEKGTHAELIKKQGRYSHLWNLQTKNKSVYNV